jgi:hypothetical protein
MFCKGISRVANNFQPKEIHGGHRDRLRARFLKEGLDHFEV